MLAEARLSDPAAFDFLYLLFTALDRGIRAFIYLFLLGLHQVGVDRDSCAFWIKFLSEEPTVMSVELNRLDPDANEEVLKFLDDNVTSDSGRSFLQERQAATDAISSAMEVSPLELTTLTPMVEASTTSEFLDRL